MSLLTQAPSDVEIQWLVIEINNYLESIWNDSGQLITIPNWVFWWRKIDSAEWILRSSRQIKLSDTGRRRCLLCPSWVILKYQDTAEQASHLGLELNLRCLVSFWFLVWYKWTE